MGQELTRFLYFLYWISLGMALSACSEVLGIADNTTFCHTPIPDTL